VVGIFFVIVLDLSAFNSLLITDIQAFSWPSELKYFVSQNQFRFFYISCCINEPLSFKYIIKIKKTLLSENKNVENGRR
jgi:hypothetical protein